MFHDIIYFYVATRIGVSRCCGTHSFMAEVSIMMFFFQSSGRWGNEELNFKLTTLNFDMSRVSVLTQNAYAIQR